MRCAILNSGGRISGPITLEAPRLSQELYNFPIVAGAMTRMVQAAIKARGEYTACKVSYNSKLRYQCSRKRPAYWI